eukprot:tig00000480_g1296.t1
MRTFSAPTQPPDAAATERAPSVHGDSKDGGKPKRRSIAMSLLLKPEETKTARVPSLFDLCVLAMARNFSNLRDFNMYPKKFRQKIVALLPPDQTLPIEAAVDCIDDEDYWKRCALFKYKNCQIVRHGQSWKQLYCENYLRDVLEEFDPAVTDIDELTRLLDALRVKVRGLTLKQLPSHMDLAVLFDHLDLTSLTLTYDMRDVGMNYERSLFGMKMADCSSLAKCLPNLQSLTYLDLSRNLIDDEKLRMIVQGLSENVSVTHLNLSHNKIADRGVRALARLLAEDSTLDTLLLADNQIHSGGGKAFGKALRKNDTLQVLDMRLNRLGDEGGTLLLEGLKGNTTLRTLNVSSNALEIEAARTVGQALKANNTLLELDLSCNALRADGGRLVKDGLDGNATLTKMDFRLNELAPETEMALADALKRNELARREELKKAAAEAAVAAAAAARAMAGPSRAGLGGSRQSQRPHSTTLPPPAPVPISVGGKK